MLKNIVWVIPALAALAIPGAAIARRAADNPGAPSGTVSVTNALKVTNVGAAAVINYPLQFGRPFLNGAIHHFPQVLINGAPVLTQADVKNRYPDGSVEFAVVSLVVPQIAAGTSLTLSFQDQPSGKNKPLSQAQMLDPSYGFDARMTLVGSNGVRAVADARRMLAAGAYELWTSGPVAQTILLADDSAAATLDLGFDGHKPFRPRFAATFWPATHQVRIRFVGEAANPQQLRDLTYGATLTIGTDGQAVFAQSAVRQGAETRWTKVFWLGGTPPDQVNLNFNLPYLAATGFVPNFDTSIAVPPTMVANEYTAWLAKPHSNLYEPGLWQTQMPTTGGRPDIGPYPNWVVLWLYTGDWRMRDVALGSADLAAAWPWHLRESASGKNLLRSSPTGAGTDLGHTISVAGRPTLTYFVPEDINCCGVASADKLVIVGPFQLMKSHYSVRWYADGAHQPDAYSIAYTLTGDPFYLHEMYLSAGWSALRYQPKANGSPYDRGPTGQEGAIDDEVRGDGWVLRNRAETAFLAPDADPEKAYFTDLTNDAIAYWEGVRGIADPAFDRSYVWGYGNQIGVNRWTYGPINCNDANISTHLPACATSLKQRNGFIVHNFGIPPQGGWEIWKPAYYNQNEADGEKDVYNLATTSGYVTPWMQHYLDTALQRAKELGFGTDPLLAWSGADLIHEITDSRSNPCISGIYTEPNINTRLGWMSSGAQKTAGYAATFNPCRTFGVYMKWIDGYPYIALAAAAGLTGYPNGAAAWQWLYRNVYLPGDKVDNLKWMILPRSSPSPLPHRPTTILPEPRSERSR